MASKEQMKAQQAGRWKTLAAKSAARLDALLHAITIAELSTDLDRKPMRDLLIAALESHLYHAARADGLHHMAALEKSREGRQQADHLAGWA